jgi:hypothetical protein
MRQFVQTRAMSALVVESRHCEERSDAAIHKSLIYLHQWIASLTLAMTIVMVLLPPFGLQQLTRT